MSVDLLQEKIRKRKNPSIIEFAIRFEDLPPHLMEQEGSLTMAYGRFCREFNCRSYQNGGVLSRKKHVCSRSCNRNGSRWLGL